MKASNKTLTRARGLSTCCLSSEGTKPELNWLPMLPGYARWCLCMVARSGACWISEPVRRMPCGRLVPLGQCFCGPTAAVRASACADQNTSVSITLCIRGPRVARRYSRAPDGRSMGRPLHNTVRDCSEDLYAGPRAARPASAGGPLPTPVDATSAFPRWEDASTATGATEALAASAPMIYHWCERPRANSSPRRAWPAATGAPAITPHARSSPRGS